MIIKHSLATSYFLVSEPFANINLHTLHIQKCFKLGNEWLNQVTILLQLFVK